MKITIDTTNKTIKLEENIKINELIEYLEDEMDIDLNEYSIIGTEKEYICIPQYVPTYPTWPTYPNTLPKYPWEQPIIIY